MGDRLRSVDEHGDARRVRGFDPFLDRRVRSRDVRDVRDTDETRPWPELLLKLRPLRYCFFVDVNEDGFGRDAPGQVVRMMLGRREYDLVVGREAQRSSDEIE